MRSTAKLLCVSLVLTALTASNIRGASTVPDGGVLPTGVWQSGGYGYVVSVDERNVQSFEISPAGCVRGERYSRVAFRDLYGIAEHGPADSVIVLVRAPTRDLLRRITALPAECRAPLSGASSLRNFDVFVSTFTAYYPFFALRGVDWETSVARARERVVGGGSQGELFAVLSDLVSPLDDGHVKIEAGSRSFEREGLRGPGNAPDGAPWSWRSIRVSLRDYLQGATTPLSAAASFAGNRRVLYGKMAGDIGYIAVLAEGGWREGQTEEAPAHEHTAAAAAVLDSILASLGTLGGVVVDLRVNSGGFDAVALELASRFTESSRVAYRKSVRQGDGESLAYDVTVEPSSRRRVTAPVAVLISANTVSAGETAALAFAALPHARLFGQPTRGILSDAIPKALPNGWSFTLSMEITRLPDGTLVEGRGVVPQEQTVAPESSAGDVMWGRDLRAALKWLSR
jgi:carboxyl-terminal processing protease